ncbi:MAG: amino acid adenylation domain-containing protein [Bacteroidota bacterium]
MIFTLPHTILNSANQLPDQVAFRCLQESRTYAEMAIQMNQLSNGLLELGIKKGDRVGIFLNRSIETAIAIYGVMNAGAVYVPIDPNLSLERVRFLIQDCGIQCLLSNKAQSRKLQKLLAVETNLKYIIGLKKDWKLETISWEAIFQFPTSSPKVRILEHDLAYIMYTSGSTGTPKGIMHTHHSGLSYAKLSADLYDLHSKDIFGNHAPLFFDISTFGYFSVPLKGATTVIATDAHVKMPASLSQLIDEERVSIWYSVPLALIQMLQRGVLEERNWENLRWILYGGEPFPIKHLRALMERLPQTRFSNVYGPAEVNQCTYYHLPELPKKEEPIPLGQIWDNTEMLILDEKNEEVATGVAGELLIRSATRMKAYWQNPALTEQSLYQQKTEYGTSKIFYRTGDLVMLDEAGRLQFLGRKDRQIKSRGYRVELDDVENALLEHEAVNEAAVFSIKDQEETNVICAVLTLKSKKQLAEKELMAYCKNKLNWYAIPQKLSIVEDLPRTPSGKIDRKVLQARQWI